MFSSMELSAAARLQLYP